jgi:hypothetical protein
MGEASQDPLRRFSALAGNLQDPYPMLAGIRAGTPVIPVSLRAGRTDASACTWRGWRPQCC